MRSSHQELTVVHPDTKINVLNFCPNTVVTVTTAFKV